MKCLKEKLRNPIIRGVARTASGMIIEFHNPGVKDLFNLVATKPNLLKETIVADRVIGRGAALLLIKGGISQVFASIISKPALDVFMHYGIDVSYDILVDNILNHSGTDICPVEKLTMTISQPDIAFVKIKEFIST
ncbi:MAG: DUF1893 domain-containing protein [Muribaculaceae bacterium]|nr:DUF1893 domain-containing protein [Muribaculaceae bacterium]